MVLTSIAQAESPRHDGIALTPVYAHQKRNEKEKITSSQGQRYMS